MVGFCHVNYISIKELIKTIANKSLSGETWFCAKIKNKIRKVTLSTSVQHSSGHSCQCNETRKRKSTQIRKLQVKPFLFTDHMIKQSANLHESTKHYLELTRNFSKISDTKYICKNQLHFCI